MALQYILVFRFKTGADVYFEEKSRRKGTDHDELKEQNWRGHPPVKMNLERVPNANQIRQQNLPLCTKCMSCTAKYNYYINFLHIVADTNTNNFVASASSQYNQLYRNTIGFVVMLSKLDVLNLYQTIQRKQLSRNN